MSMNSITNEGALAGFTSEHNFTEMPSLQYYELLHDWSGEDSKGMDSCYLTLNLRIFSGVCCTLL